MIRVGILGGTGYVGQELIRLLYKHPKVEIVKIMSESYKEKVFSHVYRNFTGFMDIACEEIDYDNIAKNIDVLFSALPYGVLMQHLTNKILEEVIVIDLGVDYRLMNQEEYIKYYKLEHKSMELVRNFTYGLCEWNRENIRQSKHICNPGCFATAMELTLLPLIKDNVIHPDVIIDGKTSYSASGRTLTLGTHFTEANDSVKPYKILHHPHVIECEKGIEKFCGIKPNITFVPHVVPMQRGLLLSCYTKLKKQTTYEAVKKCYLKYYYQEPFVKLLEQGMYVETKWVKDSNLCHLNFEVDEENNQLLVFAALDNLMKGAAGQAIQNFNLRMGFEETLGIDMLAHSI